MKRTNFVKLLALITALLVNTQITNSAPKSDTYERHGIHFKKLRENVWLHTSYKEITGWGQVLSNGLIVLTDNHAVLVDTAWNNKQTQTILDWSKEVLNVSVTSAIFTHAHDDKMGGVKAVIDSGATTYAHPLSNVLAPKQSLVPAEFNLVINEDRSAVTGPDRPDTDLSMLNIFYPGGGHTKDNIVVGIKNTDILFGGCLIRPSGSKTLGNASPSSVNDWPESISRVANYFPNATTIIPSHGAPAGRELLSLTRKLGEKVTSSHNH